MTLMSVWEAMRTRDAMQVCAYLWTAFSLVWLAGWLRTKRTQERAELASRLVYGAMVLGAFFVVFDGGWLHGWLRIRLFPRAEWIDVAGVLMTAAGLAFAIWARFHLGQNWSSAVSVKVGHELIRSGPYRWVRHPIYTGLLLGLAGTALVRGQARGLLGIALLLAGFWVKLGLEEQFMRKTFGEEYEEYSRKTGALVPKFRN
jgi:protein-S-isoprenylcysteine O-methyltransferase Ste14